MVVLMVKVLADHVRDLGYMLRFETCILLFNFFISTSLFISFLSNVI